MGLNFDENGEMDLSFALRMGTYRLHMREFCKVKATFKCISGKFARPSKFYRNTSMFEEIEHFRMSIATSSSKRFRVCALVWYILVTTRFHIKDEVNNGDGDGDELMLSVAP